MISKKLLTFGNKIVQHALGMIGESEDMFQSLLDDGDSNRDNKIDLEGNY